MIAHISNAELSGSISIPSSKSHTIRALLIAAMADGESIIANPLDSRDAVSCISAVRAFGAEVEEISGGALGYRRALRVRGVGAGDRGILAEAPDDVIDTGNSGTTLYLAAGIAALSPGYTVFTGDHQIRSRPIRRLLSALSDLGATAYTTRRNTDAAPFVVGGPLTGGRTSIECPTSQFLSSLLLAAPLMPEGATADIEIPLLMEKPYAEMTERWLLDQGIELDNRDWKRIIIPGGQRYTPFQRAVPADFSSATFFACAAAITGSEVLLRGLDMNDSQGDKAVFSVLERMGCAVRVESDGVVIAGPGPGQLHAGEFDLNDIPDALPALSVTAAFARGTTRLVNVPQARLKETDRITCMAEELAKMGVTCEELEDGLVVTGGRPRGARVDGREDHRIVMACAIAGLASEGSMEIAGAEAAAVTFPDFFELLEASGSPSASGGRTVVLEE
jgi:3-phosphoshikimate 1-carboxyvinyltransferase